MKHFDSLRPSKQKVLEASNTYFRHCHNQPFTLFSELKFFQSLEQNELPVCLQLAIIATSIRYSTKRSWTQRKDQAIKTYARSVWIMITHLELCRQGKPDLPVAQATALLCIIDVGGEISKAYRRSSSKSRS